MHLLNFSSFVITSHKKPRSDKYFFVIIVANNMKLFNCLISISSVIFIMLLLKIWSTLYAIVKTGMSILTLTMLLAARDAKYSPVYIETCKCRPIKLSWHWILVMITTPLDWFAVILKQDDLPKLLSLYLVV